VDHGEAFGRIAFAIPNIHPVHERVLASGDTIHHAPVVLHTPGKRSVEVVILKDRDGYEICFVEEEGFDDLSKPVEGAGIIDWNTRRKFQEEVEQMMEVAAQKRAAAARKAAAEKNTN